MSKDNSDRLFVLIQSLQKAEKRHFKVYSKKHVIGRENLYVQLFDAIEKHKKYDERELRSTKKFRHFASFKKRLYDQILRSLEVYYSSTGKSIRSLLNRIEILFDKSLFDHCARLVGKTKAIIQRDELFEEWLEILKWEYRLAVKSFDMMHRMRVLKEEERVLYMLNNQKKYKDLANLFSYIYQQHGRERSPGTLAEMKKQMGSPLLQDVNRALTFRARQNYYDCHYLYALLRGNYRDCFQFSKNMADLYLRERNTIPVNSSPYLTAMNNLLVACNGIGNYSEMLRYLDILEDSKKQLRSPSDKAVAFFYSYHLLNYHISTGLFEEAEQPVKRMETELKVHLAGLNQVQKIILYATMAQIYFGMENYKRCLFWLNRIMALGELKVRRDIECFIRMLYLIVHFILRSEPGFMSSLYKSTYRFLYKHQRIYKFEAAILHFMKLNAVRENRKYSLKESFRGLRAKLVELSHDPYEKHALSYFDFISWLDSKIEGRSFASIVRRKHHA